MKFVQFVILALISLAGVGKCFIVQQNETDKISEIQGGEPIRIKDAPYQVYLKENNKYICGGALIGPDFVLTAAHCVQNAVEKKRKISVVAGTASTRLYPGHSYIDGSIQIVTEHIQMYPKYGPQPEKQSMVYDLALIKLANKFPLTKTIKPISLPNHSVEVGDELILTGIGKVNPYGEKISSSLKYYKPKVVNCKDYMPIISTLENNEALICHKGDMEERTRSGDSGSPIVDTSGQLVGIHIGTIFTGTFQAGINVYHYLNWVLQTMNNYFSNEI